MFCLVPGFPTLAAESASAQAQRALSVPTEDSSLSLQRFSGLFPMLGGTPLDRDPFVTPAKQVRMAVVDEAGGSTGIMLLRALALDALPHGAPTQASAE